MIEKIKIYIEKLTIRWKLVIAFLAISSLFLLFGIMNLFWNMKQFNDDIRTQREILKASLIKRGKLITQNVASSSQSAILENNYCFLLNIINNLMENHSDEIIWAMFLSKEGKVLIHSDSEQFGKVLDDYRSQKAIETEEVLVQEYKDLIDISVPIMVENRKWGTVRCAFTLVQLQKEMDNAKHKIQSRLHISIIYTLFMTIIFLAVGVGLARLLSKKITEPLMHLLDGALLVSEGQWEQRVPVESKDEIGQLAEAFNEMTTAIAIFDDIARTATSSLNLIMMLNAVLSLLNDIVNYETAGLLLSNKKGDWIIGALRGLPDNSLNKIFIKNKNALLTMTVEHQETIIIDITNQEKYYEELCEIDPTEKFKSALIIPLIAEKEVIGILYFGSDKEKAFPKRRIKLLSGLSEIIAMTIDNARLYTSISEKKRIENELKIATDIQINLLPKDIPNVKGVDIAAKMQPAREMGGDYYDWTAESDSILNIVIGDVSGKGLPAGLIMVMAHSIVKAYLLSGLPTDLLMILTNKILEPDMGTARFMTLMLLRWDYTEKLLRYTSAGHEHLIIYRANTGKCEVTKAGGLALGVAPDIEEFVQEKAVKFDEGDILLLYTDGVTEAHNSNEEMLGLKTLVNMVKKYGKLSAQEIVNNIFQNVIDYMKDAEQFDDITLVAIKRVE